jgi:hypothetical protein
LHSKIISTVLSTSWSGQLGNYVGCHGTFLPVSYLIFLRLPGVGRPRTQFRVVVFCFPAAWLYLRSRRVSHLYCFYQVHNLNCMNILC